MYFNGEGQKLIQYNSNYLDELVLTLSKVRSLNDWLFTKKRASYEEEKQTYHTIKNKI